MYRRVRLIAAAIGAALYYIPQVGATTITYYGSTYSTALVAWSATLSGSPTDVSFASVPYSGSSTSFTLSNFTFADPSMSEYENAFLAHSLTITTPSGGETALLFDFTNLNGYANATSITVTFPDQESFSESSLGWYGIAAASPLSSFTLTAAGNSSVKLAVDALEYGPTQQGQAPTSEAATLLLTAGGFLVLLGSGRKFLKSPA